MFKSFVAIIGFISLSVSLNALPNQYTKIDTIEFGKDKVHTYLHENSGLLVRWIENEDTNTSFTLGVRTPTTDNTGVNHIIEHTVFTGSESFPSSTLFFDANANYPHTYMNASTAADMTVYPFATPYDECYMGLLDVYLDSVFNPQMIYQPHSFYEESFYYDPTTNKYGGVVYNEMKGANSQIGRVIFRNIRENVYEGTHYANDSGGEVEEIPNLTYEHFLETYRTYYYPSNMIAVLYGDIEINKVLNKIDKYVKNYTLATPVNIHVTPELESKKVTATYDTDGEGAYVIKSFVLPRLYDVQSVTDVDLWINTYMMHPQSQFRQNLQSRGIDSLEIFKDSELTHPIYSLIVSQIQSSDVEYVETVLNEEISNLWNIEEQKQHEIDTLEQTKLNILQQDMDKSRGIDISQSIVSDWVHNKDNISYYTLKEYLASLNDINENDIEVLKNAVQVDIILTPDLDEEGITEPVELVFMEEEKWTNILNDMREWQAEYDRKVLEPTNLKKMIIDLGVKDKKYKKDDINFNHYISNTELINTEIYLPTSHIPQSDLNYLFLYSHCLQKASEEITPFEGILKTKIIALENKESYVPYLKIDIISSNDKNQIEILNKANDILASKDDDWYRLQVDKVLGQFYGTFQNDIISTLGTLTKGGQDGSKRYMYEAHYPFYTFCLNCKDESVDFIEQTKQIFDVLGKRDGISIGIVSNEGVAKESIANWQEYFEDKQLEIVENYKYEFDKIDKDSVYYKEGQVDYLLYNYDSKKDYIQAIDYLASAYATKNYLQPEIRIKKGAYGSGMQAVFPNTISIYTYRDPHYKSSIEIIENMPEALEQSDIEQKMRMAKSEALSDFQGQFGLFSSDMKIASILHTLHLMEVDKEYIIKTQKAILDIDSDELKQGLEDINEIITNSQKGICIKK
ncbi:hypothetical protein AN639_09865 [Candidatus Epulonipiscium fishelsonii]|uniref:Uncharacterized protein n=1 Tax=Candidatus Epulonipiscium fishelsonii TaxID=77094 RepID=A0ACC8XE55_9FIRM|nr:hypothetical protein AN396_03945 [Epulopiscium sp. SCG-B11WGA-EpuloA1]ONI43811.1 hypothetical protein AN639_09865 [Epulopiscium sp. SCG-B05WGA-EpuloA1]